MSLAHLKERLSQISRKRSEDTFTFDITGKAVVTLYDFVAMYDIMILCSSCFYASHNKRKFYMIYIFGHV
jgi:histone H3/H4